MSRGGDAAARAAATLRRRRPSPPPSTSPTELARPEPKELIAQRDRLLQKFTVMQADLGGAFYEMAIRDHVRLDVLTRKAAELQVVDAELTALERQIEIEATGAAGHCPTCGSPFGHGDRFCGQCGGSLAAPPATAPPAPTVPVPTPAELP